TMNFEIPDEPSLLLCVPMASENASGGREATTRTLPERVGQVYYTHGLFCSSHPIPVISFAIATVLLCCYPLLNLPLPGNVPQQLSGNLSQLHKNRTSAEPHWFTGAPMCYVQQIVMRTMVAPWTDDLVLTDAFRAPLAEVFKLLEAVQNYQHENSSKSLSHVCLHVESAKMKSDKKMALPEYNCLTLSPANLWQQNHNKFQEDSNLLGTVFSYQNLQKGKISMAEILFGMHLKDTGIKRYPLRTRQRVLQYAVTLVLQEHDLGYVEGLRQKLTSLYPLNQPENSLLPATGESENSTFAGNSDEEILHIYFPGKSSMSEFVPLTVTYFILFLYMYFSVRKIELVKSKLGMAFSAVVTVLASLSMSIGLCFFFGLTLTHTGKEIFPYLVVIVGLENILVLTKSVVSTPTHLDVKIRVAQGLSREGWSITKNLLIEVTILTIGLFTFVPAIQEFCIFAIVGLLSDYFLQMLFFSTVLAIDIARMESLSDTQHYRFPYGPSASQPPARQFRSPIASSTKPQIRNIVRSKSHPRLNGITSSSYPTNVVAAPNTPPATTRVPKRLRLVHFWASTRIFQRAFMLCMVVWIAVIVYSSGVLEHVLQMTTDGSSSLHTDSDIVALDVEVVHTVVTERTNLFAPTSSAQTSTYKTELNSLTRDLNDAVLRLKHTGYDPWRRLSDYHWLAILSLYNISLSGHYLSILPPIRLSHLVPPDLVLSLRNPDEKAAHFQWQALAVALDPLDFSDGGEVGNGPVTGIKSVGGSISSGEVPFVPSSPMELFLTAVLCVISIVVLAYTMVMLYRCVCSRNYAEWRASWAGDKEAAAQDASTQIVMEAVPLVLDGHPQEVECLATDGTVIVSSCLGGQLRVWDSNLGEGLAVIDRKLYFSSLQKDYESGSPPSRDLRPMINTNFSALQSANRHCINRSGFDFSSREIVCSVDSPCDVDRRAAQINTGCAAPPIWCLDCQENLIAIGCASGRLEFWECLFEDDSGAGITSVKIVGNRVVAAKLSGSVDFLELKSYSHGRQMDWGFTAYRRTHVRSGSTGSLLDWNSAINRDNAEEDLHCIRLNTTKAHQQPITVLDSEGGKVLTGSKDHTLKVFRLEDQLPLYTLHGHCGPVTCLFIDQISPMMSGSGSQDGLLCVWDLLTGACMYSLQAHDGSVTALTYSASYVISLGTDERLCVWERFQGHLLNTIQVSHTYCSSMVMLTHNLLITSKQGSLIVWDVRTGDPVRVVKLGHNDGSVFVKQILPLRDSITCDYSNQLRIVRFPLVVNKCD
ncbi:hypothetical protein L9F63_008550, partial [Diploptera punctata]